MNKIDIEVKKTIDKERKAASKVNLDDLSDNFDSTALTKKGKSDAGSKPKRDDAPPVPHTPPKKPQTIPERLDQLNKPETPPKEEKKEKKVVVTNTDGHMYAGEDPICRLCGLEKGNTTTVCFERPPFIVTLKKFKAGKLDYDGTNWIPRK